MFALFLWPHVVVFIFRNALDRPAIPLTQEADWRTKANVDFNWGFLSPEPSVDLFGGSLAGNNSGENASYVHRWNSSLFPADYFSARFTGFGETHGLHVWPYSCRAQVTAWHITPNGVPAVTVCLIFSNSTVAGTCPRRMSCDGKPRSVAVDARAVDFHQDIVYHIRDAAYSHQFERFPTKQLAVSQATVSSILTVGGKVTCRY